MSVRVWQLARESGLTNSEVLEQLEQLGIAAGTHASTVSGSDAERFRRWLEVRGEGDGVGKIRVYELAQRLGIDTSAVIDLLQSIGVDADHHAQTVWEFDADRLLGVLEGRWRTIPVDEEEPATDAPRPDERDRPGPLRMIDPPRAHGDGEPVTDPPAGAAGDDGGSDEEALVRRILRQLSGFRSGIAAMIGLDLLMIPLSLLAPVPLKVAVDSVLGSDPVPTFLSPIIPAQLESSPGRLLIAVAVLQVLIVLGVQLQSIASYALHTRLGEQLTVDFRSQLFRHAQRMSLAHHYAHGPTDALYRVQYDAQSIRDLLDSAIPVVSSVALLIATLVITARISLRLVLVALIVMPVLFVLARSYVWRVRGQYRELHEKQSAAMEVVQETLSAVEVVKAFGREDDEQRRFVERSGETVRARVRLAFAEGGFGLAINVTTAIGTALVLFLGVHSVMNGDLRLGELLIVMSYIRQLYDPLRQVSQKAGDAQNSLAGAQRAFELLDREPEVVERPDARPATDVRGCLTFEHVSFSYDGRTPVLSDVSFEIEPGARVGLVGRTGAGKTTMVSLMMRFYDPTEGRILLDGVDLRDLQVDSLRRQFALVLQKPVLFSNSIAQNIRYARPEATLDEVIDAARAADADGFIRQLPDGYDTDVGDKGMRLSGGQRQRISLARAFLKDAPVLILDEPTSSVDRETEATIMAALERLMRGRTTVMIAHRLSTLDYCDALLELHAHRVRVLEGSPEVASDRLPA